MTTLYNVDVRTINEYIKKIYSDPELEEDSFLKWANGIMKDYVYIFASI